MTSLDRRKFLGLGMAALSAASCGRLEENLFGPLRHFPEGPHLAALDATVGWARHVLDRLTFGPTPTDLADLLERAQEVDEAVELWFEEQLRPETVDDSAAEHRLRRLETLNVPTRELYEYQEDLLLRELTRGRLLRAVHSKRQLFEQMVQFWTDHFNIDPSKGEARWMKTADDRDVIRRHALGKFPDLLRASALSPAMLWYLDGRTNHRRGPNENYARELLELHTLGVDGGYTQQDVMEAARCLTGWTTREGTFFGHGRVEFVAEKHDPGSKRVLGQEIPAGLGAGDLDRLLEIVFQHPSTARHLATKLCRRFIADEPPSEAVETVAGAFRRSHGDISETLRTLVGCDAFRQVRRNKLKRPFRFVVSALRATGARSEGEEGLLRYLLSMGHGPFRFPTPDGYPEEAGPWYGTLFWRWHFAVALSRGEVPGAKVDEERLLEAFGGLEDVAAHLLGRTLTAEERRVLPVESPNTLALLLASPAFQTW